MDSSMSVLCVLHVDGDGGLGRPALEALSTARQVADGLAVPLAVGLVGAVVAHAANALGSAAGRCLGVSGAEFAEPRYVTDAAALQALCRAAGADLVIVPGTARSLRVAAGVAERLGGAVDTHVTRIATEGGTVSIVRWYYRQRMEGTMSRTARPWVIAVEPGTGEAWSGPPASATVEAVVVSLPALRTRVTGVRSASTGEQTIRPDAELLFVAGAGWTKKQTDGQTPPAVTARSRTSSAGGSCRSGGPSMSTRTAGGRRARRTCSMSRMRSR